MKYLYWGNDGLAHIKSKLYTTTWCASPSLKSNKSEYGLFSGCVWYDPVGFFKITVTSCKHHISWQWDFYMFQNLFWSYFAINCHENIVYNSQSFHSHNAKQITLSFNVMTRQPKI